MNDLNKRLGRYLVLREIGSGGMATVYLARQIDLDRLVALKELSALRLGDPSAAQRFLRESRVAGSLAHPNIVTVHDYFERGGTPYIAMEYVSGGSLRGYIGRLSLAQVGGVLAGVLAGLAHAERRGVVHRDLKPENLLVTDDGQVKIADFGIAKATSSLRKVAQLTATGTTLGTPNYMAPEQAMGKPVGPWSDLYSVGIIAFEMLVGEVPFRDTDEPMAVLMRQVKEPIPPVRALRPDVHPAISEWVDRLLVKDPERRTRSAALAWRDLEEALIGALGPRWNRQAGLTEGVDYTTPVFETPPTAQVRARRTPPTAQARARRTPATLDQRQWARTLPPRATAPTEARPPADGPRTDGPRDGRRSWKLALPLVLLLLLAGVALGVTRTGSNAGSTSASAPGSAPTTVTSTKALSLTVPAGWKTLRSVPATGLPLSDARALGPGDGTAVAYGLMSQSAAGNSALLPSAFLASLGQPEGQVPPRDQVTLPAQQLPAWRYRSLRPLGSTRELTAYVVPTDAGVATVTCLAAPGAGAMPAKECDAIASTLQLRHAKPYPIGPSDAYAAALTSILGTLRTTASRDGRALSSARTNPARSRAANALAGDYDHAARRLAALTLSPADHAANERLVSALRRVGRDYTAAGRAAARRDTAGFGRARTTAGSHVKAVDAAIAALGAAGYADNSTGGRQTTPTGTGTTGTPTSSSPPSTVPSRTTQQSCSSGGSNSDDPSDDAGNCGEP